MLFNLIVWEFEDLQGIWECCLSCFSLSKIVNNFAIWICLFDVWIIEVDYGVSIREWFTLDTIIEYYFLLSTCIDSLDFTIMSNILINNFRVGCIFGMILFEVLKTEIFIIILHVPPSSSLSSPPTSSEGNIQELGRGATRKPTRGVRIRHPIITKPKNLSKKQGAGGIPIDLLTNYFSVVEKPEWSLYQYSVKFSPNIEDNRVSYWVFDFCSLQLMKLFWWKYPISVFCSRQFYG